MNPENLKPLGRLNGIKAEPGTVLAMSNRELDFMAVDSCGNHGVVVRRATPDEMTAMQYGEPRSIAEHHAIPRVPSVYGLVRKIQHPSPTPQPQELSKGAKDQLRADILRAQGAPNRADRRRIDHKYKDHLDPVRGNMTGKPLGFLND
jgi:hypothetical protein